MADRTGNTVSWAGYPNPAYAWFVVIALALTNMVSYVERQLITLLFDPIKKDFSLSDTDVSLLVGFTFAIFFVGFGLFFGRLADRANRKWIITIGAVFWGIATIFCGLAKSFAHLFFARVAVGIGEATLSPSAYSMITDYFPRQRVARALSVYSCSSYFGTGVALLLGGVVVQLVNNLGPQTLPLIGLVQPWQLTFIIVGVCGFSILIPLFFVKEPVRKGVVATSATSQKKGVPFRDIWKFITENRGTVFCLFVAFPLAGITGFGTVAWMPTFLVRVHGWEMHNAAYWYGLIVACIGPFTVVLGARILEWMEERGYQDAYLRLPLITIPINMMIQFSVPFMPSGEIALIVSAVSMFFFAMPSVANNAAMQLMTPNQMRGQMTAAFAVFGAIMGFAFGPTSVALITDHVFHDEMMVGYSISVVVAVISPITWILIFLGLKPLRESMARARSWAHLTEQNRG